MSDRVTCTIDGGVADVRLNRADKLNAVDLPMFDALIEVGEGLKQERGVRAVVLSGEGRGFCSGLDLSIFSAGARRPGPSDTPGPSDAPGDDRPPAAGRRAMGRLADPAGPLTNRGQHASWVWTEVPVPVIAAIHGVALGAGLQIALGADIRIVAPDASLGVLEVVWGLVPDMTGTQVLPRLVGPDVAKDLIFTGRRVTGEAAVRLGLATSTAIDPRAAAMELAATIAARNPAAIRAAKALVAMAGVSDLATAFVAEAEAMASLIGTPNQREAVAAGFEKRLPRFED